MSGSPSRFARIVGVTAAAIVALGTLAGCAGGAGGSGGPGLQADDSWTVMTYMIADTSLEYYQMSDMEEQASVGSRPGFNLVSMLDRSAGEYEGPVIGLPDWSGGKYLHITKGGADQIGPDLGKVNTGDPAFLAAFITKMIKAYPASHYALILNDHGSSWPGVGADGSADNDQLTLDELKSGISKGLKGGGVDKLDLLGFDACLMATYETASTLQGVANRMVASEEEEPGYGWNYASLETAAQGGSADDLAKSVIQAYDDQSTQEGEQQVTLAEYDLTKMKPVDAAVTKFAAALTAGGADLTPVVGKTLADNLTFGATADYHFNMTDLGTLAKGVAGDSSVASAAKAVQAAIKGLVVDKVDGQATKGASGMSIYFPPTKGEFQSEYSDVTAAGNWTKFLGEYYLNGAQSSAPTFASSKAQSQFQDGGFVVAQQITSDPSLITDALIRYGYVDGATTILTGDEEAQIDESNVAYGFFDASVLFIGDGTNEDHFYSTYRVNSDSGLVTITVPVAYFVSKDADGQQGTISMSYQPSTNTIISETLYGYDPEAGTSSEIAPVKGSTIAPLERHIETDGTENLYLTSKVRIDANLDSLTFDYRTLPSGTTLYAELDILDSAGHYAAASATGVLP